MVVEDHNLLMNRTSMVDGSHICMGCPGSVGDVALHGRPDQRVILLKVRQDSSRGLKLLTTQDTGATE